MSNFIIGYLYRVALVILLTLPQIIKAVIEDYNLRH